jgi:hypothetical protein
MGNQEGKDPIGRQMPTCGNNIKMDFKEIKFGDMD